jgi:hypothetical protein
MIKISIHILFLVYLLFLNFSLLTCTSDKKINSQITTNQNFTHTCSFIGLEESKLYASCRSMVGIFQDTILDLNTCLANDNGFLVHSPSNFYLTCSTCTLRHNSVLGCICTRRDGDSYNYATIDLDKYVVNDDGTLRCKPFNTIESN